MYVWGRPPSLRTGESIVWKAQANRYVSRHVSAGRLYLTDERVIFRSIRLDNLIWGGDFECDRNQLERCEVAEPPRSGMFDVAAAPATEARLHRST